MVYVRLGWPLSGRPYACKHLSWRHRSTTTPPDLAYCATRCNLLVRTKLKCAGTADTHMACSAERPLLQHAAYPPACLSPHALIYTSSAAQTACAASLVHPLYTPCTSLVHPLYITCTSLVHPLYIPCTSLVCGLAARATRGLQIRGCHVSMHSLPDNSHP